MKQLKWLSAMGRIFKVIRKRSKHDGTCCPVDEKIQINPDCDNEAVTVVHEMIHAIIFSGGLYESLEGNTKIIEVICEQISRTMNENFIITPRENRCQKILS